MFNFTIAEWKKMNKLPMLMIGLIFLTISTFVALFSYFYYHTNLVSGTESRILWGQITLYHSSLLYPPLLAIFTGLIFMPEFERNTVNLLRANRVSMYKLVASKFLSLIGIIIPLQMGYILIYFIVSYYDGILNVVELIIRLKWVILSVLGSMSILSIQSYIFTKTRSFSKSVTIGAIGGVFTFAIMFLNENLNNFYPYAQPMIALRSREMSDMTIFDFSNIEMIIFAIVNLIYTSIFYLLCCKELKRIK